MKANHTDISIVLDRSGSMSSIREETINGYNRFLTDQQKVTGTATLTLNQFDDVYERVINARDIQGVPALTERTFVPRNSTALLDAIGRTINDTGERLAALPEQERPGKVVVVIITDGQENASHEFTRERIHEMIRHQRETYSWEFVFLGANQDAIAVAKAIAIPASNAMDYAP